MICPDGRIKGINNKSYIYTRHKSLVMTDATAWHLASNIVEMSPRHYDCCSEFPCGYCRAGERKWVQEPFLPAFHYDAQSYIVPRLVMTLLISMQPISRVNMAVTLHCVITPCVKKVTAFKEIVSTDSYPCNLSRHSFGRLSKHRVLSFVWTSGTNSMESSLINPLGAKFFRGSIKHIFTFYVIPPHWYDIGTSNPSSSKRRTYVFYIVNIMAADVLAT